jgi:fatty-acyl-CoA synthase
MRPVNITDSATAAAPLLDTMADIQAFEKLPLQSQFPFSNSYALISDSARRFGDQPALEFLLSGEADEPAQTISFKQLAADVTRTANLLHNLGVGADDAVSIILPILPQSHPVIWGAQACGIANPINPLLEAGHIAEIINAAEAKVIVCLAPSEFSDLWQKLQEILKHTSTVHTVLAVRQSGLTNDDALELPGHNITVLDYNSAIVAQPHEQLLHQRSLDAGLIAAYFHTGGTTGRPKIAQLTHGNMAFLGQLMQLYTAHQERQTVMCGLPLFHIYGVVIQGIAAFSVGYRVVLLTPSGFRNVAAMKNFWQHVERFRVKSFSAVPTVLTVLAQIPVGHADISSLTNINSGAAPLSPAFEQSFEKKYAVQISNGYGMTETTALISRAPEQQPVGSVGMRVPYSRIRIVHLEGTRVVKDCATGEGGVILVKGPQIFQGYKSEIDNANAWIEDGWFNTGDLGYMDAEEFLYLSGRAKDLIIRSGHNIDPELIEEPLNQHPSVASGIAIGMPDPFAGELPMAFVVLLPGNNCSSADLLEYCKKHISERAAVPRRIEIIDAMPLTAVGKIFRPALRQRITETVLQEHLSSAGLAAEISTHLDKKKGLTALIKLADPGRRNEADELLAPYALIFEFIQ